MASIRLLARCLPLVFSETRRHLVNTPGSRWSILFAGNRSIQSKTDEVEPEVSNLGTNSIDKIGNVTKESNVTYSAISNLKTSTRHDLAMIFTCKVCETRSVKTLCRESYEKGVVVARCGGCNNLHLIADRLGWFGQPGSIEDLLIARGEEVRKGSIDTLSLTLEELAGTKSS
ncbi:hypothetical protein AXF42_Ash011973 [Apostasia shenzhenica]|uniref:DNL-type domain-containing protein n=1 Tax=Apostasia shenzhenica TaxID=1088818 RepID=A0A2I0AJG8_9ASPA|nr:hypothetical protein AXF42_Ash011973 [Apostasia shenzhenica]